MTEEELKQKALKRALEVADYVAMGPGRQDVRDRVFRHLMEHGRAVHNAALEERHQEGAVTRVLLSEWWEVRSKDPRLGVIDRQDDRKRAKRFFEPKWHRLIHIRRYKLVKQ